MSLLDYCTTEHQRKVITLHEEGLGYQKIGERLGIGKYSARDIVKNVKGKAAKQGPRWLRGQRRLDLLQR